MNVQSKDRRPIPARNNIVWQSAAAFLVERHVSPNMISIIGMFFGVGAGVILAMTSRGSMVRLWWLATAVFILLRLLANMLDGMVAVAAGKASPLGEVFNEVPDRVSDVVIFIGAGFAAGSMPHLGMITAVLSLFIAYLRTLGNQMGVSHLFLGPMGKSQRMFTLVAICLYLALAPTAWQLPSLMHGGLWLLTVGNAITIIRRLQRIVVEVTA